MASKDNNNINPNFDIVDFDLNEITEDTTTTPEKVKLKEPTKESTGSRSEVVNAKLKETNNDETGEPNRDMLKTILFILLVVVVACLFLGLISFIVNLSGSIGKGRERTEASTNYNGETDSKTEKADTSTGETKQEQNKTNKEKEEFEESIKDITNTVIDDMKNDDKEPEQPKEPTTATTTEASTEASTETITEQPTTEASTEASADTNIDALPAE